VHVEYSLDDLSKIEANELPRDKPDGRGDHVEHLTPFTELEHKETCVANRWVAYA
jgi:hypothetical protein